MDGSAPRWRADRSQRQLLEAAFNKEQFPSPDTKNKLAEALKVDVRKIQV